MAEAAGKVSARRAGSIDLDRSARRRPLEKAEIGRAEARDATFFSVTDIAAS